MIEILHEDKKNNLQFWRERDAQGREIHGGVLKCGINEFEYWREYDERGNEIHYFDNNGYDEQSEYDEHNHITSFRCMENNVVWQDTKWWNTYDEQGNLILSRNSEGFVYQCEYNERNQIISGRITVHGQLCQRELYEYDKSGNIINKEVWVRQWPDQDLWVRV